MCLYAFTVIILEELHSVYNEGQNNQVSSYVIIVVFSTKLMVRCMTVSYV